jgi:Gluconate 2-dehydrogenase subunit 3
MPDEAKFANDQHTTLDRRDLLKVLSTVPAAALLPATAARAAVKPLPAVPPAQGAASGAYVPKTLNAHEYKTVQVLSDIIVPADDRSGSATQAGVPEFIDDWLGFEGGLDTIRGGIVWLDLESNRQFGHDFVDLSEADRKPLLDRIAYPKTALPEDAAGVVFFNHLRNLVLGGFYSSKMGVADLPYLGNKVLAEWDGCPPDVLAKLPLHGEDKS